MMSWSEDGREGAFLPQTGPQVRRPPEGLSTAPVNMGSRVPSRRLRGAPKSLDRSANPHPPGRFHEAHRYCRSEGARAAASKLREAAPHRLPAPGKAFHIQGMSDSSSLSDDGSIWGTHWVEPGQRIHWDLGPRRFWVEARAGEIRVAWGEAQDVAEGGDGEGGGPAADPEWSRWALPGETGGVEITPALPDRALVVTPEQPFHLLPGAKARVFARVPVWVQIRLATEGHAPGSGPLLAEVPSVVLSDTWWGTVTEGELAYWLPTSARLLVDPARHRPYMAICTLQMHNRSTTPLPVDRLAIRAIHLSLFQGRESLWADEAQVIYQGTVEGSQIEMSGSPPDEAGPSRSVASPRAPVQRGLRGRTFHRILSLAGQG